MKIISLCLFLVALTAAPAAAWYKTLFDTVQTFYDNGNRKEFITRYAHTSNEDGYKPHGRFTDWYENGQIKFERYFNQAAEIGAQLTWAEDGGRIVEVSYINGQPHGLFLEWHLDRSIKTIGYYKEGKMHGLWIYRRPGDDMNNSDLMVDSAFFYFEDNKAVTLEGKNGKVLHDPPVYYNADLDLWFEWKRDYAWDWINDYKWFTVGKKVDGHREGKWTKLNPRGEIIDIIYYKNGEVVTLE